MKSLIKHFMSIGLLLSALVAAQVSASAQPVDSGGVPNALIRLPQVQSFIDMMVQRHGMNRQTLDDAFSRGRLRQDVIDAMNRPGESRPWYRYRELFITDRRIAGGVRFWQENRQALEEAERRFGVPAQVIVAIIGIETSYGANKGSHRALEALSTLAFNYPRRAEFFKKELESFLLIARAEGKDPMSPRGSYAGAMGIPQFMPSSFLSYAVDFNGDGHRDIWDSPADAIGSVANYLAKHGWRRGQMMAVPAQVPHSAQSQVSTSGIRYAPRKPFGALRQAGVQVAAQIPESAPALLLSFEQPAEPSYWVAFYNFYVISRYNRSSLYSMAVYQLSEAIRGRLS